MKKYFLIDLWSLCTFRSKNLALLSAIALSSTFGFTACSSTEDSLAAEEKAPNSPGYDPATNEVTTQFVFNVSNGSSATTRQSGTATQASSSLSANDFRGIDNCYIMCFNQATDGKYLSSAATATKSYDMSRVVAEHSLSNANSRRVLEMSLPLNTNTMLFYGRAITDNNIADYKSTFGHLDNFNVTNNLNDVYFKLGKRLTADDKTKFQEVEKLLATMMSCIINTHRGEAAIAADDIPGEGIPAYGFAIPADFMPNMLWGAYNVVDAQKQPLSPVDNAPARPLEIKLFKAYKELTTIQTAELRNASGVALIYMATNLWSIVNSVRCATPTNQAEALAKYMANLIDIEMRKYFTATNVPANGGSVDGVAFKSADAIIDAIKADVYWPATGGTKPGEAAFTHISAYTSDYFAEFPSQFALPQGSTHVKFDDTNKVFYYVENYNTSAVGGTTFTVDDYYYPAELCYFGNSPIRVSDKEHVVSDYPVSVNLWDNEATSSWSTDWNLAHVQSSTRSVAMKNDINYGTALLKATLGYSATTLKDNNAAIQQRDYGVTTEVDKEINVTSGSFKLVSVIVGDQWPKVGWNFLPKTTDPGNANYRKGYIYDNQITGNGVIPGSTDETSAANYTLVFDNYQPDLAADAQPKVYVALELQNNTGIDFFGKDNLIANGSNFYLIGELDPTGKDGPALPAYHALPPYDVTTAEGTRTVPRVFIQDHMTTANFKIGANSLKYAYLTVPDLRSSSVTLGLSVDLNWSTGLVFDNIIVGGTGN